MFEKLFKMEMKRLGLLRYDVCKLLDCTRPTLKARLKDPGTFTLKEVLILKENKFNLDGISDKLNI